MKTEQIIKTLREHNDWRRGIGKWSEGIEENIYFDTISAHEIGLTIDAAIEQLQTLENERDEARREAMLYRDNFRYSHWFSWEKGSK